MADEFEVGGAFGIRWRDIGGADGPYGKAIGPEEDFGGAGGRRQRFEGGELAWSPNHEIVTGVYRLRNEVCFEWGLPPFAFDHYRYEIAYNGVDQGFAQRKLSGEGFNVYQQWIRLQGFGEYTFRIKACDVDLAGEHCRDWTTPVRVDFKPAPDPDTGYQGLLADRWRELGASAGPLGKRVGEEESGLADGMRRQRFEHGVISTAPTFGPSAVIAGYQRGRTIEVNWGGSDTAFNAFRVEIHRDGQPMEQRLVWLFLSTEWARLDIGCGQVRLDDVGDGLYWFYVYPKRTESVFPSSDGFTTHMPRVDVPMKRRSPNAEIKLSPLDGTPAGAYATHRTRVDVIARHYALEEPLRPAFTPLRETASEDNLGQIIAHLHTLSLDPGFTVPGELPSRVLFHAKFQQLGPGRVGTNGDYDFALKQLVIILYRYPDQMTAPGVERALRFLVPASAQGPFSAEVFTYAGSETLGVPIVSETENHVLMISSCQYLINQILLDRTGDPKYDNQHNGMTDSLLSLLQGLAQQDFIEFNSRAYSRLSFHAILNLYEFAWDRKIRAAAQIVLDYLTTKFAVSSSRLRRVAPFRRRKERVNRSGNEFNDVGHPAGDPMIGIFLTYAGLVDPAGRPIPSFPYGWMLVALIAGLADYRPPPAAYILAMRDDYPPAQHSFYHGDRRWAISLEGVQGGVEIYYRSPSFLLSAGGMHLPSGMGFDEFHGYKDIAIAQAITLIPTWHQYSFADLIRFDLPGWEREFLNTAVHLGFACGVNLQLPTTTQPPPVAESTPTWNFLHYSTPEAPDGGFFVAAYRTPKSIAVTMPPPFEELSLHIHSAGFLYAAEAENLTFDEFKRAIRENNPALPADLEFGTDYTFTSHHGHTFTFEVNVFGEKYRPRIKSFNGVPLPDLRRLRLVEGPYLNAPGGHDGRLEISHPDCHDAEPLVLDFRDRDNPVYQDNIRACPQPWVDRAQALQAYAAELTRDGNRKNAAEAHLDAARIFERLTAADPQRYRSMLSSAVFDMAQHRAWLAAEIVTGLVREAAFHSEISAGLRPADSTAGSTAGSSAGSTTPVDYGRLGEFVPNEHWPWPQLDGALWTLSSVLKERGDLAGAEAAALNRVRLNERLVEFDAPAHRGFLRSALFDLLAGFRIRLNPLRALEFARRAVIVAEHPAGLRTSDDAEQVDYGRLGEFVPNEHWPWPYLDGAVWNLSLVHLDAGRLDEAQALTFDRVRLNERLVEFDAPPHRGFLRSALFDLLNGFGTRLPASLRLRLAQRAVIVSEHPAGLRASDDGGPVDYERLGAFVPNEHWPFPYLAGALWNLATALKANDDLGNAAAVLRKRVRVYERLVEVDPAKYRAGLDEAKADADALDG